MTRVVHFEIHAQDTQRAADFYHNVFGWDLKKWGGPQEYWLITTGPKTQPGIDGGLLKRIGSAPQGKQAVNAFVCTIDVASVDDALIEVNKHGGSMALAKMPVPGVGWLAYCKDTEGNIFGVMQSDTGAA